MRAADAYFLKNLCASCSSAGGFCLSALRRYGMVIQVVHRVALGVRAVGAHGRDGNEMLAGFKIERRSGLGDAFHQANGLRRQRNRKQHRGIFRAGGNVVGDELHHAMRGDFCRARGRLAKIVIERDGDRHMRAVRGGRRRRALGMAAPVAGRGR